jgi:hypothetical protein
MFRAARRSSRPEAWNARRLAEEDIARLILDGTVVRGKIDKKSTSISTVVALGVRRDGQKVLLSLKNMGGESEAAWRVFLEEMASCKLRTPEFLIVNGAPGSEATLAALWPHVPIQRCTVHKHRNLFGGLGCRCMRSWAASTRAAVGKGSFFPNTSGFSAGARDVTRPSPGIRVRHVARMPVPVS